uniref:non-specific serine/threonine protein kinase n=1 Tax=Aegilops tauschii subsp. strangulata TaxID=200361 RepID=A0A452Z767_AEGTS
SGVAAAPAAADQRAVAQDAGAGAAPLGARRPRRGRRLPAPPRARLRPPRGGRAAAPSQGEGGGGGGGAASAAVARDHPACVQGDPGGGRPRGLPPPLPRDGRRVPQGRRQGRRRVAVRQRGARVAARAHRGRQGPAHGSVRRRGGRVRAVRPGVVRGGGPRGVAPRVGPLVHAPGAGRGHRRLRPRPRRRRGRLRHRLPRRLRRRPPGRRQESSQQQVRANRADKSEVEAIGRVRHKNLVRLLGYCVEGAHRILVYEYVDNGNLEQWLHGDNGPVSPLSWDARMDIVLGTAKGITYLHEGLEPKVVHRDIKSSNILLDKRWNSKVSDFGLAKLLGSDSNYVTTRVMGTFGYVAPEYASTGMLNERSDVYSFGVLIMEIISGRCPVDYARPPTEVNLVEWLKKMVSNRDYEAVLDPKLPEKPSSKALKKALLVALRCVDPDSQKRPKMGHAIHMLEVDDFPYRDSIPSYIW